MRIIKIAIFLFLIWNILACGANAIELLRTYPESNEHITTRKADLTLRLTFQSDGDFYLSSEHFKMWLNGKDISRECLVLGNSVSCKPKFYLQSGENHVKIMYKRSKTSEMTPYEWSFIIDETSQTKATPTDRTSLTFNSEEKLGEGDILDVKLVAAPNGNAAFSLGSLIYNRPMKEESPGVYRGIYEIKFGDGIQGEHITATLRHGDGSVETFATKQTVSIAAFLFKVRILNPLPDSTVGQYFDIEGKTRPGSRVSIAPSLAVGGSSLGDYLTGSNITSNTQGAIEVFADEKGYFKVALLALFWRKII